ncbi:Hypothetical protein UVM_LOCUS508 [uncultured virus]|nr:Hypothetical protein UVM_LOCUS508 [uncultured virus]
MGGIHGVFACSAFVTACLLLQLYALAVREAADVTLPIYFDGMDVIGIDERGSLVSKTLQPHGVRWDVLILAIRRSYVKLVWRVLGLCEQDLPVRRHARRGMGRSHTVLDLLP